jgi:hypothetical protein
MINLVARIGDALGLQAGGCGRSDRYEAAGHKPPSKRLLGVSANFRFLLTGGKGFRTEPFLFLGGSAGGPLPESAINRISIIV